MLFFLLANLTDDGLQACVENPDAFADACDSVRVPGAQLLARYATLGQYDFVVSSDVFEHVAPPVSRAFENVFHLLKPGGFFLLTVPFRSGSDTVEHFPELHDYSLVEVDGSYRLVNRTRDGVEQVYDNLVFHGGEGTTLEMRIFGESALKEHLGSAGFQTVTSYGGDHGKYGIYWPNGDHTPMVGRKVAADRGSR